MIDDPFVELDPEGLEFTVSGEAWRYHEKAYVMLHKPAGYECSLKPGAWPGVHNLLPPALRKRGLQPVGRLDQDTTGLLLMTDDGPLLHQLTSPKKNVPKVYEVTCKYPVSDEQLRKLVDGVVLDDEPGIVKADAAERVGDAESCHLRLTLVQGKYHQVKRMVAAAGNRCETLHRVAVGRLELPADLAPGEWRWIDPSEV